MTKWMQGFGGCNFRTQEGTLAHSPCTQGCECSRPHEPLDAPLPSGINASPTGDMSVSALPVTTDEDDSEVLNIGDWEDVDVEVTLDSGCCKHVLPSDAIPGYVIEDSPGSRRGANFIVGNGELVPNEGQAHLNLAADSGNGSEQLVRSTFQVADLTRPLMSVSQICAQGHKCVFEGEQAMVIGQDGETICRFRKENGLYVATMKLKPPTPFTRQAP